jgi:hypothetical protein
MSILLLKALHGKTGGGYVPPPGIYDVHATAFFAAVEAVPGEDDPTDTQKAALNEIYLYLKAINKFDNCPGFWPCFGKMPATHAINAKTLEVGTFAGGWIHTSSGAKPNGTNAYFDMKINPKVWKGSSAIWQMGAYHRTEAQADQFDMGAAQPGKQAMLLTSNSFGALGRIGSDSISAMEGSFSNSRGYTSTRRLTNTDLAIFKHGDKIATTATANGSDLPNVNLFAGAYNNNGTAAGFSTRQHCWLDTFADVLSDAQIYHLNILIEGVQESFNRGVQ